MDDAVRAANTAVSRSGGDAAAFIYAGRALLVARQLAAAERDFAEAVRIHPSDPEAMTWLGKVKTAPGQK